jgi:hypothetical protein
MKRGTITGAQSELLGRMGQQFALSIGAAARDFIAATGLPNDEEHFNASLLTLLEAVVFLTLVGTYDTPRDRRLALDDMMKSLKKLMLNHSNRNQHEH